MNRRNKANRPYLRALYQWFWPGPKNAGASKPDLSKRKRFFSFRTMSRVWKRFWQFKNPVWLKSLDLVPQDRPTKVRHFINPWSWIRWMFRFAMEWLGSRSYLSLGPSIPAAALLVFIVLGLYTSLGAKQGHRVSRKAFYQETLARALAQSKFEKGMLAADALLMMEPENEEIQFQKAMIEVKLNSDVQGIQSIQRLASKGNGVASIWLMQTQYDLMGVEKWKENQHSEFRLLARNALAALNGDTLVTAKMLYSSYLAKVGAASEAMRYMVPLAVEKPEINLSIAYLARDIGDASQLQKHAEAARIHLEKKLASTPSDVKLRIELAKSLVLLKREEDATRLLLEGNMVSPNESFTLSAGEVLIAYANRLIKEDRKSSLATRFKILSRAMELAPNSPLVIEHIIQLLIENREAARRKELTDLRQALLKGLDTKATHFLQGTILLQEGKIEEARKYLELAKGEGDFLPGVLNNLAVAISQNAEGDLEEALRLVEMANEQLPNHPYILETRGQILFKLGKFNEAIQDLQKTLETKELLPSVLPVIAKAYREIGLEEVAKDYESALKNLQK